MQVFYTRTWSFSQPQSQFFMPSHINFLHCHSIKCLLCLRTSLSLTVRKITWNLTLEGKRVDHVVRKWWEMNWPSILYWEINLGSTLRWKAQHGENRMGVVPESLNRDPILHFSNVLEMILTPSLLCSWSDECQGQSQSNWVPGLDIKSRINSIHHVILYSYKNNQVVSDYLMLTIVMYKAFKPR